MKRAFVMLSLAAVLAVVSSAARADLNSFLRGVNKQALSDIRNFNDKLSKQFGVPVPDVDAIIKSVPKPEDAFMILQLGEMSNKPPKEVLQKYQSSKGKGWGTLAKELGIKPGSPEFHALKRGNLSFTGRGDDDEVRDDGHEERHGDKHGKKGKGRDKERGDKERDGERERGRGHGKD